MLETLGHGVPRSLWQGRGTPLRRLPDGRTAEQLTRETRDACTAHARAEWPSECVGLILVRGERQGYIALDNVHPEPHLHFEADPVQVQEALTSHGGALHGVHHSHTAAHAGTGEGLCPSYADMQSQLSWGVPFYVTALGPRATFMDFFGWGDQLPYGCLRNRQFRSGVHDCYSLARHAHFAWDGTVYPDGPRESRWWDESPGDRGNPLTDRLSGKGFIEVSVQDIRPKDDLLFAIRRGEIVHCGVYLGQDLFLHHLHGRLSKVDPLPQWRKYLARVVRYAPGAQNV